MRAGHNTAPRGAEKLTKVATDEYSGHHARVTLLIMRPPQRLSQHLWSDVCCDRQAVEWRATNVMRDDDPRPEEHTYNHMSLIMPYSFRTLFEKE